MDSLARLSLLQSASLLNDPLGVNSPNLLMQKAMLVAATQEVCRFTGRALVQATYTDELYAGGGRRELFLNQWPVTALSSVKFWDGTAYTAESSAYYELLNVTEGTARVGRYIRYPVPGQEANATWPAFPNYAYWGRIMWAYYPQDNIKLTYTAGYDTTGWDTALMDAAFIPPHDLEQAVAQLAYVLYMRADVSGVAAESYGPRAMTYRATTGIPQEIAALLQSYRALRV